MKKLFITWIFLSLSIGAQADEYYKCYNLEKNGSPTDVTMKISTSFFTKTIQSVELIKRLKGDRFEASSNPFNNMSTSHYDLDEAEVKKASQLSFKELVHDKSSKITLSLSESLINQKNSGYAYYYAQSCFWIMDCTSTSRYFKCERI